MADLSVLKLPNNTTYNIKDATARSGLADKQDTLVSGTNIKTINNVSILGSGNITAGGGNVAYEDGISGGGTIPINADRLQGYAASDFVLASSFDTILQSVYPIGAIYISTVSTSPSVLFGFGTWIQIEDTFLLSAGQTYDAGNSGGNSTSTPSGTVSQPTFTGSSVTSDGTAISSNQMPSHAHSVTAAWQSGGSGWSNTWKSEDKTAGNQYTGNTGGGQTHTHSVTAEGTVSQPTFTGSSMSIMPPYLVVYMWKRTA